MGAMPECMVVFWHTSQPCVSTFAANNVHNVQRQMDLKRSNTILCIEVLAGGRGERIIRYSNSIRIVETE